MSYTSLSQVLEESAISGQVLVSVRFAVNRGRITTVEYRNTFDVSEDARDDQTDELTAMTALLRQYGKKRGKGKVPYTLAFSLGQRADMWVGADLVTWLEGKVTLRETVPAALVEQLDVGTAVVVAEVVAGTERRAELEALKVEEVRKLAASLKVVGAWRTRKAELVDLIISAEQEAAEAS